MDKTQQNALVVLFLIFVIPIIIISIYTNSNRYDLTRNSILNLERHTKVVDIYINKEEHNFTYVKFSNGKSESLDDPYKIGDSISKNKGDSIEYIFRGDTILKYNMLESIRKEK